MISADDSNADERVTGTPVSYGRASEHADAARSEGYAPEGDGPEVYDAVHDVAAPASTGRELSLGRFLHKLPIAMVFVPNLDDPSAREIVRALDERLAEFGRTPAQAIVVASSSADDVDRFREMSPGNTPVVSDADRAWAEAVGVESGQVAVVVGLEGTVVWRGSVIGGPTLVGELLTAVAALSGDERARA
jgi:peroxiredoxin